MTAYNVQDGPIPGLIYINNFILDHNALLDIIKSYNLYPISGSNNSRCVSHFGYTYAYDGSGVSKTTTIPTELEQLLTPDILLSITGKTYTPFDQVIINQYKKSQCISPHIDHVKYFGDIIGSISLGTTCDMIFTQQAKTISVSLEPGSLVLLTEQARYNWKHSLTNKSNKIRYSITFRHVRL